MKNAKPEIKPEIIRALWWKQPFASLMLHGKIETRTYPTNVRGKVLICAAQKGYKASEIIDISGLAQYGRICVLLNMRHYSGYSLPLGQAIAIGTLVNCRPMTPADEDKCFVQYRKPWYVETKRGTVKKQLYCWEFADVKAIEPFPLKGKQGWATLDTETINKIHIL